MSAVRAVISSTLSQLIVSQDLALSARRWRAARRRALGAKATVHYFHQPDDPYSALTLQLIEPLRDTYRIEIRTHLVPPPALDAAPEAERLKAWSLRDAERLAGDHGLAFRAHSLPEGVTASNEALQEGAALREKLGHYLGATFFFEGEWYWGVDRLPYLEDRLRDEGLSRTRGGLVRRLDPDLALAQGPAPGAAVPNVDFYVSFRSPYTLLAAERIGALVEAHGARLTLRPVLPMVMRGLPVPRAKSLYIMRDAAREARRQGAPFGRMVDPRGQGAENGLAVLHHAIGLGQGLAFARSFLRGVFAEGRDAADSAALLQMAERAGLSGAEVEGALADPSWRNSAEENRTRLFDLGLWGVPSFQVDDRPALWGQDRLHHVQQDLLAATAPPGTPI